MNELTEADAYDAKTPARYLCARCRGTGQQEAGCWDRHTKSYTAPAGVCELCAGAGYLGLIRPSGDGITEEGEK